jgi:hypothetical protein
MKIAFVGASGYGNVGDDTYPVVFSRHLQEHELLFLNSDLPKEMPAGIDLLVFGGGGILYNNPSGEDESAPSPHFCQMRHYLKWAIASGVPFGFSSCGFQFRPEKESRFREALKPWVPFFEQARFITLRSPNCVRIMRELVGRDDAKFYPDAAYLMPDLVETGPGTDNTLTVAVAGRVFPAEPLCKRFFDFFASMNYPTVWLGMGARVDDEHHLTFARKRFPECKVIDSPTPEEAFRQIARSKLVITGRYHGRSSHGRVACPSISRRMCRTSSGTRTSARTPPQPSDTSGYCSRRWRHWARLRQPCLQLVQIQLLEVGVEAVRAVQPERIAGALHHIMPVWGVEDGHGFVLEPRRLLQAGPAAQVGAAGFYQVERGGHTEMFHHGDVRPLKAAGVFACVDELAGDSLAGEAAGDQVDLAGEFFQQAHYLQQQWF